MPSGYKHGDSAEKAMIRVAVALAEHHQGVGNVNKSAIFRHFGLSRQRGYTALAAGLAPAPGAEAEAETRGRPTKIGRETLRFLEWILWNDVGDYSLATHDITDNGDGSGGGFGVGGVGGRAGSGTGMSVEEVAGPTWDRFIRQVMVFGIRMRLNPRTLRRKMGTLSYRKCLSCGDDWVNPRHQLVRRDHAAMMRDELPRVEDWRRVRFSGELHFGFGLGGRVRLLPRAGEKYACPTCEMEHGHDGEEGVEQNAQQGRKKEGSGGSCNGWEKDIKRVHVWVAMGIGYKSDVVFYDPDTSGDSAGALSAEAYRSLILQDCVRHWPRDVIWEQDCDPHTSGRRATDKQAEAWKDARGLRRHRGCPEAPDLCPLDAVFPRGKQWTVEALPDWEADTLRGVVRMLWEGVGQEGVDAWVGGMVGRLAAVVEGDGGMVRF